MAGVCAGSVDFSDSDEEDENIAGISDSNGGLSSFPVDSWEDTWDDSDAPVSHEVPPFTSPAKDWFIRTSSAAQAKLCDLTKCLTICLVSA